MPIGIESSLVDPDYPITDDQYTLLSRSDDSTAQFSLPTHEEATQYLNQQRQENTNIPTLQDVTIDVDESQTFENIVKGLMLNEIKNAYKREYQPIWDRVVNETGKEPFFRWHGELNLRAYEVSKQAGNTTEKKVYVTHNYSKFASKFSISPPKLQLEIGYSHTEKNGISFKRISFKDVTESKNIICDINYDFPRPYDYIDKSTPYKKYAYFTNNILNTYIEVTGINSPTKEEKKKITSKLSQLYHLQKKGNKHYFQQNNVDGFIRCSEIEEAIQEEVIQEEMMQ